MCQNHCHTNEPPTGGDSDLEVTMPISLNKPVNLVKRQRATAVAGPPLTRIGSFSLKKA